MSNTKHTPYAEAAALVNGAKIQRVAERVM
jgi:hypothetical protein